MNNIITASRMNSLMNCPRSHFWSYEVGLTKEDSAHALRFGKIDNIGLLKNLL